MTTEFNDNRIHIKADPSQVQMWELMELESLKIKNVCLVLCRYVANGNGYISHDLPEKKPLRRMSDSEKEELMNSAGFEWLETLQFELLKDVASTFVDGASESIEKKA